MAMTFDQIFAVDEANSSNVAKNASVLIFAPGDTSKTPLTITTVDGQPLANPIVVNDAGFGPAFMHATLDRVAWEGAGYTGFFTSYDGIKGEAVAARQAAELAAANAAAEAEAELSARIAAGEFKGAPGADGSNVLPTDAAIRDAVNNPASETRGALNATYAEKSAVVAKGADTVIPSGTGYGVNLVDAPDNAGIMLHLDHSGGVGSAPYAIDIRNRLGAGIPFVIHQYGPKQSVRIDNTDNQPSVYVKNTENTSFNPSGIGSGDFYVGDDHDVIRFRVNGSGSIIGQPKEGSHGLEIVSPSTGAGRTAIFRHNQPSNGVEIVASATAAGFYPFIVNGQNYAGNFITTTDGGQSLILTKNGTGTGEGLRVVNKGTGSSITVRSATAELFAITAAGLPKWTAAANEQSTVGAAGAASAPPATPTKYLKVVDSAGATYVIPAYAAV